MLPLEKNKQPSAHKSFTASSSAKVSLDTQHSTPHEGLGRVSKHPQRRNRKELWGLPGRTQGSKGMLPLLKKKPTPTW